MIKKAQKYFKLKVEPSRETKAVAVKDKRGGINEVIARAHLINPRARHILIDKIIDSL